MRNWRQEHRDSRFKWPLKLPGTRVEGVSTLEEAQEVMGSKIRTGGRYNTYGASRFTSEGARRLASFNKRHYRKVFRQAMRIVDTKLKDSDAPNFRAEIGAKGGTFEAEHQDLLRQLQDMGAKPENLSRRGDD